MPEHDKPQRKTRVRLTKDDRDKAIQQCRALLRTNATTGDIKKLISAKWGVSRRSVERLISVARERNRQALGLTAEDAVANSISFWAHRQMQAMQTTERANREMAEASENRERASETLFDPIATGEAQDAALAIMDAATKAYEHARKSGYTAGRQSVEAQDRIDKIRGVYAPEKRAITDAKGEDVPAFQVVAEPQSAEQRAAAINQMYEVIRSRCEN